MGSATKVDETDLLAVQRFRNREFSSGMVVVYDGNFAPIAMVEFKALFSTNVFTGAPSVAYSVRIVEEYVSGNFTLEVEGFGAYFPTTFATFTELVPAFGPFAGRTVVKAVATGSVGATIRVQVEDNSMPDNPVSYNTTGDYYDIFDSFEAYYVVDPSEED